MLRPFAHPVACCWMLLRVVAQSLKPVKLLAPCKRTQHCWPTTPNIVGCYMLRSFAHPVACCCAKFETGQTFQPTTPNISFVPWSPKHSATMLDPFATALPTLLEPRARITHSLQSRMGCISFPGCTASPNIDGSCCSHLHTILVLRARRFLVRWSGLLQIFILISTLSGKLM